MDEELFNRSLGECGNLMYSEYMKYKTTTQFGKSCGAAMNHKIQRFCSYDKQCQDPDYALQRATNNLEHYLAVVLTEELIKYCYI